MASTMFNIYQNLHIFAEKYRGYQILSDKLDQNELRKKMQVEQYVTIEVEEPVVTSTAIPTATPAAKHLITIALINVGSKYIKTTTDIRSLMFQLTKNDNIKEIHEHRLNRSIFLITKDDVRNLVAKTKNNISKVNVENYLHIHFKMEIPKGPHCSKHVIMKPQELQDEIQANFIDINHIPLISDSDPQCIWIGAKTGNIVKIVRYSINAGLATEYRKVIPRSITEEIKSELTERFSGVKITEE